MVVAPIDAEKNKTQHIAEKHRNKRTQRSQISPVRRPHLQHHDGDDDGHHAIAERFHASLSHIGIVDDHYVAAVPPDVRKVSDLPRMTHSDFGAMPPAIFKPLHIEILGQSPGDLKYRSPEGQRPSAHQAAEPRTRALIILQFYYTTELGTCCQRLATTITEPRGGIFLHR